MFAKLLIVLTLELALCYFQEKPHPAVISDSCSFDVKFCKVACEAVPAEVLYAKIMKAADEACYNLNVELIGIDFKNNTINENILPRRVIYDLELRNCKFDQIQKEAFAYVDSALKIVNSGMRSLEKALFESVNLMQFKFVCETYNDFWIESGAFTGMQKLRYLQISKCLRSEEHIRNLTASVLANLEVLNLADNELKQLGSLANFRNLEVIYLQRNKLERIERDAFYGTKLHSIDISDNFLQVIEEGILADFRGTLMAFHNPWNCNDCKLLWFKNYLLRSVRSSNEHSAFYLPKCFDQSNLMDFSFNCPKINEVEACVDASKLKVYRTQPSEESSGIDVIFKGSPVYFNFFGVDDDSLITVIMSVTGFDSKHFIYWHDNSNMTEKNCITNMPSYPIPMELKRGSTYTFWLAEEAASKVDLNSCFGFKVWDDWDDRTWIPNKFRTMVIVYFALSLIAAILLTTICMCFCLKRQRTKVVVANLEQENYQQEQDDYQTGYITPNQPIYESLHYNRKPHYVTAIKSDEKIQPYFDSGDYEEIRYKNFID